jgi:pimeloyl-ACP methyl ester carboxylesterase
MHTLTVVATLLAAGAAVTVLGARLIERLHLPRGRFVDVGGLRQHVVEMGEGRPGAAPVVLLHGAGCNLEDMRTALGEPLAARYRVILIDRPGLGWSERAAERRSSPAHQAAVLSGILDRLGVERAILVGHSWGGTLALTFALDHPQRVAGIVAIAPPTHPWLRSVWWLYVAIATPVAGWLLAHTLTLPAGVLLLDPMLRSAFLPERPAAGYIKRAAALLLLRPKSMLANARDVAHLKKFLAGQAARYRTVAAPTIILTGDRDTIVSWRHHAEVLASEIPGAKLELLKGFGHMLHHSAAAKVVAAVDELSHSAGGADAQ